MSINISAQEKTSSSADIKLLSDTEKMQMIFNELRSNRPRSLDTCDFRRLPLHKRFISLPNLDLRANPADGASTTQVGLKSAPDLTLPAVDRLPLTWHKVTAVRENSSGDAPEIKLSSAELPVSKEPLSRDEPSVPATLTPRAAEEDGCCIETPLAVSSPFQPVEAGVTDTAVTSNDRRDSGVDLAVTTVAPRKRSLWKQTKNLVRRVFCCDAIDRADEYGL